MDSNADASASAGTRSYSSRLYRYFRNTLTPLIKVGLDYIIFLNFG